MAQKYDPIYCEQNGWLSDDYRALQHDFEGMKVKAEEFCNLRQSMTFKRILPFTGRMGMSHQSAHKSAVSLCNSGNSRREVWKNMTLDEMVQVYYPSKARGRPTLEEGQLIGSWTCAMGSALCDMGCLPQGIKGNSGRSDMNPPCCDLWNDASAGVTWANRVTNAEQPDLPFWHVQNAPPFEAIAPTPTVAKVTAALASMTTARAGTL